MVVCVDGDINGIVPEFNGPVSVARILLGLPGWKLPEAAASRVKQGLPLRHLSRDGNKFRCFCG